MSTKPEPASEPESKPSVALTYESAKLRFVGACACIALGLAVAGSVDRATGGVLVLIGWIAGVTTLHRLGRAGSNAT